MASPQSWAALQTDVLCLIQKNLSIIDYIRFSAVCVSWKIASKENPYPSAPEIPWLMRADTSTPCSSATCIKKNPTFLRLSPANDGNNKFYEIPLCRVEDFHELDIISSIHEWLVIKNRKFEAHLLNPFTGVRIPLPSYKTLPVPDEYHHVYPYNSISKVVVGPTSTASLANGSIAVAIVCQPNSTTLAYTQLGDSRWIIPDTMTQEGFDDILPYKGLIFAITRYGHVTALDFSSPILNFIDMTMNLREYVYYTQLDQGLGNMHLVESSSRLLLVRRTHLRGTIKVEVYKLDADQSRWVPVDTLGSCSLFLGRNQGLSLTTADYPELRCNCIYFSHGLDGHFDFDEDDHELLYNLEDGTEESYYGCDDSWLHWWSSLWVAPRLGGRRTPGAP